MKSKLLNVLSLILVLTAGLAAYADRIEKLAIIPEQYAWLWPFVLTVSAVINRIAAIIGDFADDWQLNGSFKLLLLVLIPTAVLSLFCLTGCVTDAQGNTRWDLETTQKAVNGAWDVWQRSQGAPGPVASPAPSLPLDTLYHQGAVIAPPASRTNPANIVLRDAREL